MGRRAAIRLDLSGRSSRDRFPSHGARLGPIELTSAEATLASERRITPRAGGPEERSIGLTSAGATLATERRIPPRAGGHEERRLASGRRITPRAGGHEERSSEEVADGELEQRALFVGQRLER